MNPINKILNLIQENPFLITGLGLTSVGILTFWLKDFPKIIFTFLKRQLTTNLIITNQHRVYCKILKYIDQKYRNRNFRVLKLITDRWGDGNGESITSIGYGIHWIIFKSNIFILNLSKEEGAKSEYDKESLTIMKIGRGRKLFDQFIDEVEKYDSINLNKLKLYRMNDHYWGYIKDQQKRDLDTIFIENDKKDKIISTLNNFLNSEKWYLEHGVPYQLGILLYGAPGTGKTSLIRAIASWLNYPIYYLPTDKFEDIDDAMFSLEEKCILVIEDIDSSKATHTRKKKSSKKSIDVVVGRTNKKIHMDENIPHSELSILDELYGSSLSNILNSLDGLFSIHGRILIATTNHIEKLDDALIRPGRIDLQIEVGYVNNEILHYFVESFFPEKAYNHKDINIKDEITIAMLQNMILQKYTYEDIINNIKKE